MDAPADGAGNGTSGTSADRDLLSRVVALLGVRADEARSLLEEATTRWRGDALRVGEGTRHKLRDVFRELGLVTRDDWDELELRVAQLEHRIRLLEDRPG
jgi:polyhydroxyalkanoate synthesis regulator phasin